MISISLAVVLGLMTTGCQGQMVTNEPGDSQTDSAYNEDLVGEMGKVEKKFEK